MSLGTHITHCCIVHGCKYGDEDCPVAIGTHKQDGLCEYCYWDSEYKRNDPMRERPSDLLARSKEEQEEHVEAVWNEKHSPKTLTPLQQAVKAMAERHGYRQTLLLLQELESLPFTREHIDIQVPTVIDMLKDMKEIP